MATVEEQIAALIIERDALNGRLAGGVVRIAGGDRSVQYDLTEARRRRDEIVAEIGRLAVDPCQPLIRQVRIYGTRGY